VMMVDAAGNEVAGDQLLYIMTLDLYERGALEGAAAGTLMTILGPALALRERDIPFVRARVGDSYVTAGLHQHRWTLYGGASGHLVCLKHTTTGDGIIAGLQVLRALRMSGKTLAEACQGMNKCPQKLINVRYQSNGQSPLEAPELKSAVAAAEGRLADTGRV